MGVDPAALAVAEVFDAPRLAEINAAGQFADEQDVEPGDDLALEARRVGERGKALRRAQVGEHAHPGAKAEQPSLGALVVRLAGPLRSADRAHQHRVGRLRKAKCRVGQRYAVGVDRRAAEPGGGHRHVEVVLRVEPLDDARGLRRDFGADPVAGEEKEGLGHAPSLTAGGVTRHGRRTKKGGP